MEIAGPDTIADIDASGLWPDEVVTEVRPAREFRDAEPEHQDYLQNDPSGYTCHYIRPGWKLPNRSTVDDTASASAPGNLHG
jgi:peptide-methionine (S)-S-oxide reductase